MVVAFQDVQGNWGLSMNHVVVTTTNGSNFVAALLHCEWFSYFGYNLNLAVIKVVNVDCVQ